MTWPVRGLGAARVTEKRDPRSERASAAGASPARGMLAGSSVAEDGLVPPQSGWSSLEYTSTSPVAESVTVKTKGSVVRLE